MAEHEVKVDPIAKTVTGIGALVLLVAVAYLVVALIGTVNKNTTHGPVAMEPAAPSATPAAAAAPAAAAPTASGAGDVAAGQALFATCSACHGAKGEGAGMFPKLAGLSAADAAAKLKKYRAGETLGANTAMMTPNAKALSDTNITDLAAFIASLGGAAVVAAPAPAAAAATATPPAAVGKGDAAAGQAKYATCAACHGANGEGAGMFPKLAGTPADKIADLLKKYRAGETVGANTAMMAPNAKPLSDADIDNLAAYISGIGGGAAAPVAAAQPVAAAVNQATIARGQAIYTTCVLCHGQPDAKVSRLLNAPILPGHPASAVTALMKMYAEGKSVGPNSSFMWPVAQGLDAEDTAAVAAYVGTLKQVH